LFRSLRRTTRRPSGNSNSASTSCSKLWMGLPLSSRVLISKSVRLCESLSNSSHVHASTIVVFPAPLSPKMVTSEPLALRVNSRMPLKLRSLSEINRTPHYLPSSVVPSSSANLSRRPPRHQLAGQEPNQLSPRDPAGPADPHVGEPAGVHQFIQRGLPQAAELSGLQHRDATIGEKLRPLVLLGSDHVHRCHAA